MKETEYVRATNRVKVSLAKIIMKDVLEGDEYGMPEEEYKKMMIYLSKAEERLFKLYSLEDD